jgi:hypothetical protein
MRCPSCPTRQLPTWFLKAPLMNLSVSFRQNRSANITCTNRLSTSVRAKHLVRARCDQNHRARIFPNFADASAMLPCSRRDPEKCPFIQMSPSVPARTPQVSELASLSTLARNRYCTTPAPAAISTMLPGFNSDSHRFIVTRFAQLFPLRVRHSSPPSNHNNGAATLG